MRGRQVKMEWRGRGQDKTRVGVEGRGMGTIRKGGTMGVKGVRVESADVQGAEGMRGGLVRGEKKGGGAAQEGQGQRTSDSMKEREGQRPAYSYQLFKHIPPHTETLQSEHTETPAHITKNNR